MPDIVDFPGGLPFGDRSDPQLVFNTRSGGVSINGFEQIVSPLSQRWEWSVSIPVHRSHKARGLRAFLAKMRGRFNYARIRMCDQYRINRREMGAVPGFVRGGSVPHSDGAYFSDGAGYEMAHGTTELPSAPVAGQTTLTVDPGFLVRPGTYFSINEWLYVVTDVGDAPVNSLADWVLENGTWDDGGYWLDDISWGNPGSIPSETLRTISFEPPIRQSGGTEIDWDATCLWQLATDRTGGVSLRQGRFGTVTLDLVEPVNR